MVARMWCLIVSGVFFFFFFYIFFCSVLFIYPIDLRGRFGMTDDFEAIPVRLAGPRSAVGRALGLPELSQMSLVRYPVWPLSFCFSFR